MRQKLDSEQDSKKDINWDTATRHFSHKFYFFSGDSDVLFNGEDRNKSVAFHNSNFLDVNIVDATASWCECLSGRAPLRSGIRNINEAVGGVAIAISRIRKDIGGLGRSIFHDSHSSRNSGQCLSQSYAAVVMGPYVTKSKCGTMWFSSMLDGTIHPSLSEFQHSRGLRELVIIPIEVSDKYVDFLEFHFEQRLDADRLAKLNMLAATLVGTWSRRATGLFSEALLSHRPKKETTDLTRPILSVDNPARLSRCEYRVCLFLSRGLSVEAVEAEMEISRSTIRSHLRNIYQKTMCKSLSELTYKLLALGATNSDWSGYQPLKA